MAASATTESFTNSSVEYFLLEPAAETSGGGETTTSSRQEALQQQILSPYRDEAAIDSEERICFDEELTLPSTQRGESSSDNLLQSRPSFRFGSRHSNNSQRGRLRANTELSGLNYLNVVTYAVHLAVWWGVAVWGLDALLYTQWEVTELNETLVTPSTWAADYLWVPVLVTEAAFAIAQLLPHYRTRPIVTNGTGYFFFYTVLLQIAYTFLYCFGLFMFSFIAAILALVSLLSLLASQGNHVAAPQRQHPSNRPRGAVNEYLLFRFPFYLHAGWMVLMTVDHFSLLFRRYSGDAGLQLAGDIVALGVLLPVVTYALSQAQGPDFVIPVVILWSYVSGCQRYM
jgi:hypothetical protein